ncbi:hypothetical protein BHE74_00006068 [Ensete ventricosum]|nr:hypothetical protein BHE74_00006068 [Ensete ventricosum]
MSISIDRPIRWEPTLPRQFDATPHFLRLRHLVLVKGLPTWRTDKHLPPLPLTAYSPRYRRAPLPLRSPPSSASCSPRPLPLPCSSTSPCRCYRYISIPFPRSSTSATTPLRPPPSSPPVGRSSLPPHCFSQTSDRKEHQPCLQPRPSIASFPPAGRSSLFRHRCPSPAPTPTTSVSLPLLLLRRQRPLLYSLAAWVVAPSKINDAARTLSSRAQQRQCPSLVVATSPVATAAAPVLSPPHQHVPSSSARRQHLSNHRHCAHTPHPHRRPCPPPRHHPPPPQQHCYQQQSSSRPFL